MAKNELVRKYEGLLEEKGLACLEGVTSRSSKADLMNAIACLECTDEKMDELMGIVKHTYANICTTILGNRTDFKKHSFNRLFVFNTARICLA